MTRTNKPASLANARALRRLLHASGHELRVDRGGHLVIHPSNAELQAGAQGWLRRYRSQLLDLLRFEALIGPATGEGNEANDGSSK